ncbi:hypothetical protein OG444_01495 [Streptomyces sp. NBC_01232]|uniref:hypothetical protein n=1 Tax=Streptomyces sp. NBC_01232 TaxID=2903786 RepID=UPI002E0DAFB6|nr:hypothetical protein OG444_01495 [Streptomyces sp. NBC_01232]
MITTDPVGEWFWETTIAVSGQQGARQALHLFDRVHSLGSLLGIVDGWGHGGVKVVTLAAPRDTRYEWEGNGRLEGAVEESRAWFDHNATLHMWSVLPGEWLDADGGAHRSERLFALRLLLWPGGHTIVSLAAYSDAWMTLDVRERPQPEVAAANAPRLASLLSAVSDLLGAEVDPGDPTYYGRPTASGFEDLSEEGTDYTDPWSTFAVPARWQRMLHLLPKGYQEQSYEAFTEGPVKYIEVRRSGGTVGWLWAGKDGSSAGYEPRTAAGEIAFAAGVPLLLAFVEARRAGSAALDALRMAALSEPDAEIRDASSLDTLQELSGC